MTLLEQYKGLKESGSVSDFPNLLANVMYKIMIAKFKGVSSPWREYTLKTNLSDFKTADRVVDAEAPDLLEVEDDGEYSDSSLTFGKYTNQLITLGRTFSIGRNVIINDDLHAIQMQPSRFGKAAARTLVKRIVAGIENDGNTYDGKSMFHLDHANYGATALANTAAGMTAVQAGMTAIRKATDPNTGEKMGLEPKFLVVPPDLEGVGSQLINSTEILPVSTNGGGTLNTLRRLKLLVEPFFTSTTGWYVMADPEDAPAIEVGFLNGKETPDLLMKKSDTVNLAGGDDPFGYEFDQIFYKVRYDAGVARALYQGIYRGKA